MKAAKKKSGTHLVTIRKKAGVKNLMTGMNTEVLLDGVPLLGATAVYFHVNAREPARVTIEMFADVEIEGEMEVDKVEPAQAPASEPEPVTPPKPIAYNPNLLEDPRAAHRPDPNQVQQWQKAFNHE